MKLLETMQSHWRNLSDHEQRWLQIAMVVVTVAMLWWLVLAPPLALLRAAPAQHTALDAQLQRMLQLQSQAKALQAQPVLSAEDAHQALVASLKPLGASAQWTVQSDRTQVTLKGVSAATLAQWLSVARQNAHAVPTEVHLTRNAALTWDGTVLILMAGPGSPS